MLVISSPDHHVKVSIRSPLMIPSVAIVDPELTLTMPPSVTASTGMDALTQVIEAYVSSRANPMTDVIAAEGIKRGAQVAPGGLSERARPDSAGGYGTDQFYLAGLALANGGLGAVHGFAGPIGGMFQAAHGAICASLLPYVMKYNARVIQSLSGMDALLQRFRQVAAWVTGNPTASIDEGVKWLEDLAKSLQIPGLRDIGIERADFPRIIEKSKASSSMQKNPVKLDERILEAILDEAY